MRRPVQRAEEGARSDDGVAASQLAAAHAGGDERPDAALVAIALGDDERAQAGGQRVDFQMRRRSFDAIDQAQDVRHRKRVQPRHKCIALFYGRVPQCLACDGLHRRKRVLDAVLDLA